MAFMQAQMTDKQTWHEIDGPQGTSFYPGDVFSLAQAKDDYGTHWAAATVKGYGVRASAPGYMDCTDWEVYDNESDAYDRFCELDAELREESEEDDLGEDQPDPDNNENGTTL